jgi:alpha-D-ribose 1-methylphosphonate 5-phosphate C-P lyase
MPIAKGWGTGGLHITLAIIGKEDTLKMIDQGSDASVNACILRDFVYRTTNCSITFDTSEATIIQTRHRITEEQLSEKQIMVFQVPTPEPLRMVEPYEYKTRLMHAEADYAKMWLTLYELYIKWGNVMLDADYPVMVHNRYVMSPSPIPRWDIPNLHDAECLYLFGAGTEKRLYAVPPHTKVEPLEFEDVKFYIENFTGVVCASSGINLAYLDEMYMDDGISKKYYVNDSNYLDKIIEHKKVVQHSNKYLIQLRNTLKTNLG